MFALRLIHSVKRFNAVKNVSRLILPVNSKQGFARYFLSEPIELKSLIAKDVVLFEYQKPALFVLLNIFSCVQCVFWSYLGLFLFQMLKKTEINFKGKKFWTDLALNERKYANILSFISVVFGWSIFLGTMFYTTRSVRKIILHKGGRNVTLVTYVIPGFKSEIKIPLSQISSAESREKAKKYVSLKVKDKFFYFLLNKSGKFQHPQLFDFTVGIKRSF